MGIFSWLSSVFTSESLPEVEILGKGTFEYDVVGESNYQKALKNICGGRTKHGVDKVVQATLVHEDDNPHDKNAVRVDIQGHTVGYLKRSNAKTFRRRMEDAGYPYSPAKCSANIVGGWDKGFFDKGDFGVNLDMPLRGKLALKERLSVEDE